MKKVIAITALVTIVGLTGFTQAFAYMGHGGGGMRGPGGCNGAGIGMNVPSQMDEATKAKFDVFFKDTQDLRKQMVVKRAEKRALMQSEEPDVKKVGQLAGELFDLRTSMHAQAEAAGLGDAIGNRNRCAQNYGPGNHHKGRAMNNGYGKMMGQGPAE